MDPRDHKVFEILTILNNQKATISQRELARSLKISLGSVNGYLKELCNNQFISNESPNSRIVTYHLTEDGLNEKRRLSIQYCSESIERFADIQARIYSLFESLKKRGVRRIAFWGVNYVAEIAYLAVIKSGIQFVGIVDKEKAGRRFLNYRVLSPEILNSIEVDRVVVTDNYVNTSEIEDVKLPKNIESNLVNLEL